MTDRKDDQPRRQPLTPNEQAGFPIETLTFADAFLPVETSEDDIPPTSPTPPTSPAPKGNNNRPPKDPWPPFQVLAFAITSIVFVANMINAFDVLWPFIGQSFWVA